LEREGKWFIENSLVPLPNKTVSPNGYKQVKPQYRGRKNKWERNQRLYQKLPPEPGKNEPVRKRNAEDKE
jgi:hypothetical protein